MPRFFENALLLTFFDRCIFQTTVTRILFSLGWPKDCVIDCGNIAMSRPLESVCLLWCYYAFSHRTYNHALKLLRSTPAQPPIPAKHTPDPISPSTVASVKIAILGTGDVGVSLAKGFLAKGHSVWMGTRDPTSEKAASVAASVGPGLKIAGFAEAAKAADVVVLATAGPVTAPLVELLGESVLGGKLILDALIPWAR